MRRGRIAKEETVTQVLVSPDVWSRITRFAVDVEGNVPPEIHALVDRPSGIWGEMEVTTRCIDEHLRCGGFDVSLCRGSASVSNGHRDGRQVVLDQRIRVREADVDRGESTVRVDRIVIHLDAVRLLEADSGIERAPDVAPHRVVPDYAAEMPDLSRDTEQWRIGILPMGAFGSEAETDAPRAIEDPVPLDDDVAAGLPEMHRVLGKPSLAVNAPENVVPDDPVPCLVSHDAPSVTGKSWCRVRLYVGSAAVRQLQQGASQGSVVVHATIGSWVDFDELLPPVDDVKVVQENMVAAAPHVNRVVIDVTDAQISDHDVGCLDGDHDLRPVVVAVEHDGLALAGSGTKGDTISREDQLLPTNPICAIVEQNSRPGPGARDDLRQSARLMGPDREDVFTRVRGRQRLAP